jgi:hypothetical protein
MLNERGLCCIALIVLWWPSFTLAQTVASVEEVARKLERLEQENQKLVEEIRALREQLTALAEAQIVEQVQVNTQRTEDLAQTKVEASEKLPVTLEGMVLMNTYWNSQPTGGTENPTLLPADPDSGRTYGATLRQSLIGLRFVGPEVGGARVTGLLDMDLFGGSSGSLGHTLRLRTAAIELDWGSRKLTFGQEKPLISPRNPVSLAQVGVSPLTNAGNPWVWRPQIRFEQRFGSEASSLWTAQVALMQTNEGSTEVPREFERSFARARPGLQGRVEYRHRWTETTSLAVASGFHWSESHVAGASVPSRVGSADWHLQLPGGIAFDGLFYAGQNLAHMGALRQGFVVIGSGEVEPVRGIGGWAQLSWSATDRLSFHAYGGQHDDRASDLRFGGTDKNEGYAVNAIYRLAQNVLLGFETSYARTGYTSSIRRRNTHHDLSIAYLF